MGERGTSKTGAIVAVVVLVAVVAIAAGVYALIGSAGSGGSGAVAPDSAEVSPAAESARWDDDELSMLPVTDVFGNEMTLGEFCSGRVTVINVWATWCPYCVDEMQDFQGLYDKYGDDIQFVMLDAADDSKEVAAAIDYVKDEGFTFPAFIDSSRKVQRHFGVRAYPTTIVIDRDGTVLSNAAGRIQTGQFDRNLAGLL